MFLTLIYVLLAVLEIAAMWVLFTKAGQPGWAAIIPIYNIIVWLQIVGRPLWWIVLFIIPIANIVALVLLCMDLAKSFGRSGAYGIGILLLGFIFLPMLAFGDAQYKGPVAAPGAAFATS